MTTRYRLKTVIFAACEPLTEYGPCTSPRSALPVLRSIWGTLDGDAESFGLLALDSKGCVVGFKIIGQGTATACLAAPREIFRAALALGAVTVLVCHNHPSGDTTPSREDVSLTDRLRKAGEAIGVPLADHIILGSADSFYSFRASEGWDR